MRLIAWIAVGVTIAAWLGCYQGNSTTTAAEPETPAATEKEAPAAHPFSLRFPSPPLERGVEWVNTEAPIKLTDVRGRFVLLDFWTYCCINCMQLLPELKKLEQAFPNELVVIGIHSAKFEGEQDSQNIREAVLRYEIEHPVVNDARMAIWRSYGARSWPTLVLIDPAGEVIWAASGERSFEEMQKIINRGLPYYRQEGLLAPAARPVLFGGKKPEQTPLRFPGKVLADATGDRLFIADSNHNRIVVTNLEGTLQYTIGSGAIGRADGDFQESSFNHPQGMALVNDVLYVADTENHLLRKIDLSKGQVTTAAGTGEKGNGWPGWGAGGDPLAGNGGQKIAGSPKTTPLASPWALWPHGAELYIAMAGPHQIWKMPLDESTIGPYAGNGREDIADGPLLPPVPYDTGYASFAQPSELASDGKRLFVADSEGSTVRVVPFDPSGSVATIVGLTGTLFDFGDVDGTGRDVRLQHPLGVAWWDGKLYVADTYNNKIKLIDVDKRSCRTVAGTGQAGNADAGEGLSASFNEPGGISAAGGKLYVADTNSHAIRLIELTAPYRVTTVEIAGLAP